MPASTPKPVTELWRPELTRLPVLSPARRAFRAFAHGLAKMIARLCLNITVEGIENLPAHGPALLAINHLGDSDVAAVMASLPYPPDALSKVELYDLPILGKLIDYYGVIWLHRGQPDRRALRAALDGLTEGRVILIAPEGRYSTTGALEEGSDGIVFLATKAHVPVIPIGIIGTENENVYGHLKKFKRAPVQIRVGKMLRLDEQATGRKEALEIGKQMVMKALASLLPERYRGVYS